MQDVADISSDPVATAGLFVILLLSLSWHEAAHAWMADRLGDPTAREQGRVSLNPLRHLDPVLSVILPLLLFLSHAPVIGGGKPVPINVMNFRHRARDFMFVALAGPGSNLLLAAVFGLLFVIGAVTGILPSVVIDDPFVGQRVFMPRIIDNPSSLPHFWLQMAVLINLGLALFNLMPVPPLDGSRLIGWLLPERVQHRWYALDRIGIFLVIGLVMLGGAQFVFPLVLDTFVGFGDALDRLASLVAARA